MLKLILCVMTLILPMQGDSSTFYVEGTEVHSDYGSIYILRLANQLVPPDKLSKQSDIDCLVREINRSGIFSDVRTALEANGSSRKLIITAAPSPRLKSITINEVTLVGFSNINKARFQSALDNSGVKNGERLTKYSLNALMEKITDALREASQNNAGDDDTDIPWITITSSEPEKVKLRVSPAYIGCEAAQDNRPPHVLRSPAH
jgi:hypothetical protein